MAAAPNPRAAGCGRIMAIDTEATDMERGVPIQIAYFVADAQTGCVEKEVDTLVVVPVGAVVNPDATRLHGITPERASRDGRPLRDVLAEFAEDARGCDYIVAHNARADRALLVRACAAVGVALADVPWECTQLRSTAMCRLRPLASGLKPPRLAEAHAALVGKRTLHGGAQPRSHNARSDAEMCMQIWFALRGPRPAAAP